jgi:hypothetical protein
MLGLLLSVITKSRSAQGGSLFKLSLSLGPLNIFPRFQDGRMIAVPSDELRTAARPSLPVSVPDIVLLLVREIFYSGSHCSQCRRDVTTNRRKSKSRPEIDLILARLACCLV